MSISKNNKGYQTRQKNSYKNQQKKKQNSEPSNKLFLIPIILVIAVLPLITKQKLIDTHYGKFAWFPAADQSYDFFLYYKQVFFITISSIMALVVFIKAWYNKRALKYSPIFFPLTLYAILAILSSVFSKYRSYSFRGTFEQFESLFVLLGYCLVVYYTFLIVKTEQDVKLIIHSLLISVIALSLLGITQIMGHDFFATEAGLKLIIPRNEWHTLDSIQFTMGEGRVYLTLFNPNYVGVYAVLITPLLLILLVFTRKLIMVPIYLLALAGILISLVGSKSKAGIIGLAVTGLLALILMYRYLIKYFYFSIPIILLIAAAVLLYNKMNNNILYEQLKIATKFDKVEYRLTDIQTKDNEISITYNGNNLHIRHHVQDGHGSFIVVDDNNTEIPLEIPEGTNYFKSADKRFPGFLIGNALYGELPCFYVTIEGNPWYLTNQTEDGTYYYLNRFGKPDKIITAPSAVFTGYEKYGSSRGYIWSRTLPLLKKYPIIGSGADTYAIAFPQQDYVNLYNSGFRSEVLTKPHNLFLQMGVQTGTLSMIAFLAFYAMYFISSFKLYIKGYYNSYFAQVGIAILLSTAGYMIMGISNDSNLSVAPLFWTLIGLGIAVNQKAKPMIEKEVALAKEAKKEKRQEKEIV